MKSFWRLAACATVLSAQIQSIPDDHGTINPVQISDVDPVINQAIAEGKLPGAVLVVGHNGQVVYRKAYGKRALVPQPEAMTVDTIFDCASLTKVVATTSSLM